MHEISDRAKIRVLRSIDRLNERRPGTALPICQIAEEVLYTDRYTRAIIDKCVDEGALARFDGKRGLPYRYMVVGKYAGS